MAQIIDDLDGNSIIPTENMLPDKLLLIPLQSRPIFPGIFTPLMINAPEDVKVVEKAVLLALLCSKMMQKLQLLQICIEWELLHAFLRK